MRVVFRADAGPTIGYGHVVRCLTLAGVLRDAAHDVLFICREHPGHLCGLVEERGFRVERLPVSSVRDAGGPTHAEWLGASWEEDAVRTVDSIGARPADWLVVDHYSLDERWETAVRPAARQVLAIDDLADRRHDCDALLDQNLVAAAEARYEGLVPGGCRRLLGPAYALLQPDFAQLRARVAPRSGPVRRILVSFGGTDAANLTGRTIAAFLALGRGDLQLDAVISRSSPHLPAIAAQACDRANIRLYHDLPTLAPLMAQADLAIGAGGTSTWERLCLGLPALVVTLAGNQVPVAEELSARGLVRWIGDHSRTDEAAIARELAAVLALPSLRAWSESCLAAVDGQGAQRVAAALGSERRARAARPGPATTRTD